MGQPNPESDSSQKIKKKKLKKLLFTQIQRRKDKNMWSTYKT